MALVQKSRPPWIAVLLHFTEEINRSPEWNRFNSKYSLTANNNPSEKSLNTTPYQPWSAADQRSVITSDQGKEIIS